MRGNNNLQNFKLEYKSLVWKYQELEILYKFSTSINCTYVGMQLFEIVAIIYTSHQKTVHGKNFDGV